MRKTRNEWAGVVERFTASELGVRKFCKQEELAEQSLRNWIKRLATDFPAASTVDRRFVEIRPDTQNPTAVIIRFPCGVYIEVHPDTDRPTLEMVISLMARSS